MAFREQALRLILDLSSTVITLLVRLTIALSLYTVNFAQLFVQVNWLVEELKQHVCFLTILNKKNQLHNFGDLLTTIIFYLNLCLTYSCFWVIHIILLDQQL